MTRNTSLKVAVLAGSVLALLLVAVLLLTNGTTALASPAAQATPAATARPGTPAAPAATAVATARPAATATAVRPAALPTTGDATGGPNWLLLVGGALLVAGLMALLTLGNRAPQRR